MKTDQNNKKIIIPTDKQIKKMFVEIKNFQKSNTKYLLSSDIKIQNSSTPPNIITTNNTNN